MNNTNIFFLIISALIFTLSSCKKDDPIIETSEFSNALFIVNEGNFTTGNASLTYYNRETKEIAQKVFYQKNKAPLGDVANSICIDDESMYLIVNNSHTIYKVNNKTGLYEGKIDELTSPRFMLKINDSIAFVSDLYENNITVINTKKMTISSKIYLGRTSENLLKVGDKIFITNWSAYNQDKSNNMLMVIDRRNMQISDSIEVGIEPNSIVLDSDNSLWVLCSGGFLNQEKPSLCNIDPNTNSLLNKIEFEDINTSPTKLKINPDGDTLYFLNKHVYKMGTKEISVPEDYFIEQKENVNFYSLAISPENEIFVSDANDYNRSGDVYRYTSGGSLIHTFKAGIIPGYMAFMD